MTPQFLLQALQLDHVQIGLDGGSIQHTQHALVQYITMCMLYLSHDRTTIIQDCKVRKTVRGGIIQVTEALKALRVSINDLYTAQVFSV
jgi:hypothetical protein